MAMIDIKDLKKSFGNNHVLNGVNLSVNKGDIVAIIGSSGSGKSTLVRCIAGLEKPDTGQILLNGEEYLDDGKGVGKIGMVFQNFNLFPHYTARENITKPLTIVKKMEASTADEIAEKLLRKVKLENAANQYPATLSGGQKQRLAIARSLAMEPEIIVFDEPTSSLDPTLAHEVFQTIKELAAEGQTMLIVTHQINAIKNFATRVVFLNDGIIEVDGTCGEVFENPTNENLKNFLQMVEFDDL